MLQGVPSLMTISRGTFSPNQVAGLVSWYKADAIAGLVDGNLVSTWNDSFGSKNLTVHTTAKPTYKTNIINGLPVLRWDGTNDMSLHNSSFSLAPPTTYFFVGKQTDKANAGRFVDSVGGRNLVYFSSSGFLSMFAGTATAADAIDHSGAFHVITAILNGASSSGYVDQVQVIAPGTDIGSATATDLYFESDSTSMSLIGDVAEIIIYSASLSNANRLLVENYLKNKYKTP